MSPFPHVRREQVPTVNREGVNELLSMPYDEPDMADVERACDEVRHEPVLRTLCLALSDDLTLPLQCKFGRDHFGDHDWQIEGVVLSEFRADLLRDEQDTPSGRLPVRTPGAALEEEREVVETWTA